VLQAREIIGEKKSCFLERYLAVRIYLTSFFLKKKNWVQSSIYLRILDCFFFFKLMTVITVTFFPKISWLTFKTSEISNKAGTNF